MIRQCCVCLKFMGTKEPFSNTNITSGYCDSCFDELEKKLILRKQNKKLKIKESKANAVC